MSSRPFRILQVALRASFICASLLWSYSGIAKSLPDLKETLHAQKEASEFVAIIDSLDYWPVLENEDHLVILLPVNEGMSHFPEHLKKYYFSDNQISRDKLRNQIAYHVMPGLESLTKENLGKHHSMHGSNILVEEDSEGDITCDSIKIIDGPIPFKGGNAYLIERFIFSNIWK